MKKIGYKLLVGIALVGTITSCNSSSDRADAYGNFEAKEVIISAEAMGKVLSFTLEEGEKLAKGNMVGLIDTIDLHLNKQQLLANKSGITAKSANVLSQITVLRTQLKTAQSEQDRVSNMFKNEAATQRQLDEVNGKVDVLKAQIKSVETQNAPIISELAVIDAQLNRLDEQLSKSIITNPIDGTVLVKYTEEQEVVSFGKPLYKIANLDELELKVYISETQLAEVKIGQTVRVSIDGKEGLTAYDGTISWISAEAEFTPKIIQTKEERVNLVYAMKIIVKNDGALKIGMPAEVSFQTIN
ncbi:HlyD family secretion protein [Acidiluteibacter ferrifornacis]|uniref:HlyD family efflux transporter periplasmic adaptor subunit n=1 Tax=Acidiluteibacter ferrifornacis TaxID=2692424 RepID=A0A6N9NH88_9FLAO|nr:HlyD family efflux transporter periplasmic adaptor subunit [Acidiluteibacter ferrifornacis]MBR9830539.1 HlyD family efflux transporter periplasmic adaptor subunit [bacterium]NBG64557.1 HlyD family efflux transporter periplasmic adaptor subunit [Acidiluteibacter ferrifornacis]